MSKITLYGISITRRLVSNVSEYAALLGESVSVRCDLSDQVRYAPHHRGCQSSSTAGLLERQSGTE